MGLSLFGALPDMLMGKDPRKALEDSLKTAALVGTVYATGGAAAGAMGGAGAAGAAAPAAMGPMMPTAGAPLLDAAGATIAPSGGGLLGTLGQFADKAKPFGQAAQSASQIQGLLSSPQQQVQSHAPPGSDPNGSQTLSQLYQQGTQMSPEMQARMQRKTMWG